MAAVAWTCIQELHETRADIAHLSQVHGPFKLAGVDLRYTRSRCWGVARHEWMSHWNQDGNSDHVGVINACHRLFLLSRHVNSFDCTVHAKQVRAFNLTTSRALLPMDLNTYWLTAKWPLFL